MFQEIIVCKCLSLKIKINKSNWTYLSISLPQKVIWQTQNYVDKHNLLHIKKWLYKIIAIE